MGNCCGSKKEKKFQRIVRLKRKLEEKEESVLFSFIEDKSIDLFPFSKQPSEKPTISEKPTNLEKPTILEIPTALEQLIPSQKTEIPQIEESLKQKKSQKKCSVTLHPRNTNTQNISLKSLSFNPDESPVIIVSESDEKSDQDYVTHRPWVSKPSVIRACSSSSESPKVMIYNSNDSSLNHKRKASDSESSSVSESSKKGDFQGISLIIGTAINYKKNQKGGRDYQKKPKIVESESSDSNLSPMITIYDSNNPSPKHKKYSSKKHKGRIEYLKKKKKVEVKRSDSNLSPLVIIHNRNDSSTKHKKYRSKNDSGQEENILKRKGIQINIGTVIKSKDKRNKRKSKLKTKILDSATHNSSNRIIVGQGITISVSTGVNKNPSSRTNFSSAHHTEKHGACLEIAGIKNKPNEIHSGFISHSPETELNSKSKHHFGAYNSVSVPDTIDIGGPHFGEISHNDATGMHGHLGHHNPAVSDITGIHGHLEHQNPAVSDIVGMHGHFGLHNPAVYDFTGMSGLDFTGNCPATSSDFGAVSNAFGGHDLGGHGHGHCF